MHVFPVKIALVLKRVLVFALDYRLLHLQKQTGTLQNPALIWVSRSSPKEGRLDYTLFSLNPDPLTHACNEPSWDRHWEVDLVTSAHGYNLSIMFTKSTGRWIRDQQKAGGIEPGEDVYIILRLDGCVRRSGKGMPDWQQIVKELPPIETFLSKLERCINFTEVM